MIGLLKSKLFGKDGSERSELFSGTVWAFALRILGVGGIYLFTFWVGRYMGAGALGLFAVCQRIFMLGGLLGRAGLDTAIVRFVSTGNAQGEKKGGIEVFASYPQVLRIAFLTGSLASVLLFFSAPYLDQWFLEKEGVGFPLRIIALAVLPYAILTVNAGALRGLKRTRHFVLLTRVLPFSLAFFSLLYFFFLGELSASTPVKSYTIAVFAASLISFYWIHPKQEAFRSDQDKQDQERWVNVLRVSFPMFLSASIFMLMNWMDILMLGAMGSDAQVGVYEVAIRIATANTLVLFAVNSIAAPKFAEHFNKGNERELKKLVKRAGKGVFWGSLPILMLILLFPDFLLGIFGKAFIEGRYALLILVTGQFFNAASGSVLTLLQMSGHQRVVRNIVLVAALLNFALNLLLIPYYGIMGAAIANSVGVLVWNAGALFFVRQRFGFMMLYLPGLSQGK